MGWEVGDDGLGVLFSRDIPHLVRSRLREPAYGFLESHGLGPQDIARHACHPGGAKVLDALEEVYRLPSGELKAARDILRRFGNMSAATAMFVLLQLGRVWVLTSLGRYWTTRIITVPDALLVRRGPFRFVRHPNYLIVEAEIIVVPMIAGAWELAVIFGLANAVVLALRIRVEERALSARRP